MNVVGRDLADSDCKEDAIVKIRGKLQNVSEPGHLDGKAAVRKVDGRGVHFVTRNNFVLEAMAVATWELEKSHNFELAWEEHLSH